ncbi:MAG: hypothetical protein KDA88_07340 [Planctomycetaceae bacterium]|nr:hypothetical protein [Planctomycetaceae bacterium]MCB9953906.1 hypothetical protein [Planctomycetaceae bacterium]
MSSIDAEEFAKSLELRGLHRSGESPEFVVVQAHDKSIDPPCDWLILFEYERRLIATIRGSDSRTVVAAAVGADYDPDAVQHYTAEEIAEKFEFVERNGSIDTYREKATGKLVYNTRETQRPDEIFSQAFDTVWNLHRDPGRPARFGEEAAKIRVAIENLQSLAAKHPDVAKIAFALGMAWFAIGEDEKAQRQLTRAVELEPENTIMLKELASVCLTRTDLPSALAFATKAVTVEPDDIQLLGNLAVIQLLSGNEVEARTIIKHAIHLQPDDMVNGNIQAIIESVASGTRPRPTTLEEMMSPRRPKPSPPPEPKPKSWWSRLFGS